MEVVQRIACNRFTVTLGKLGTLHYATDDGFIEAPSLATRVADRVGAGDAVLALTSPLVALNAPWDIVGFVGNVAGAQMVTELGNRVRIDKVALCKYIISLLK
jgi:bifunctional ADP-heptose synthase (sugar kinase/adenylyltransferase)